MRTVKKVEVRKIGEEEYFEVGISRKTVVASIGPKNGRIHLSVALIKKLDINPEWKQYRVFFSPKSERVAFVFVPEPCDTSYDLSTAGKGGGMVLNAYRVIKENGLRIINGPVPIEWDKETSTAFADLSQIIDRSVINADRAIGA